MRYLLTLGLIVVSVQARAIVLERTTEAADSLGYQVASEVEFTPGSAKLSSTQVDETLRRVGLLCPRTVHPIAKLGENTEDTRLLLLAWSDREYPTPSTPAYSSSQQKLAARRAEGLQSVLQKSLAGRIHFERINMANRKPHLVPVSTGPSRPGRQTDIKLVLQETGAAPMDDYTIGLFGEYAQHAKVVVWIDCTSAPKKNAPAVRGVELASTGF